MVTEDIFILIIVSPHRSSSTGKPSCPVLVHLNLLDTAVTTIIAIAIAIAIININIIILIQIIT